MPSPSTGVQVASASTSMSDQRMAAMKPGGGNTTINAPVTNIAQNGGGDIPEVASTAGGGGSGDVDGATLEVSGESEAKKARPDNAEDES